MFRHRPAARPPVATVLAPFVALVLAAAAGLTVAPAPGVAAATSLSREVIGDDVTVVALEVQPDAASVLGTQLALTATVTLAGDPVNVGSVRLLDGGAPVATVAVDAAGQASAVHVPGAVGAHRLEAIYDGVPGEAGAARSDVVTHTVTAGDPVTIPTVHLGVTPAGPVPAGAPLTLTATVDGAPSGGQVAFLDGSRLVGVVELLSDGGAEVASASHTPTPGARSLSARYLGDPPETSPSTGAAVVVDVLPARCPDQAAPGDAAVVRHAYLVVLGRCPDPGGFAYWTGRLDAGTSPATVGRALALSAEGIVATVDTAYRRVLARRSDAGGRAVWAAKLRAGWTTSRLWAGLAASPEFVAGAPSGDPVAALVDRAFAQFLRRPADPGGKAYWSDRLSGPTRSGALRALISTPEALGNVVDDTFLATIGRTATADEAATRRAQIRAAGGDWRTLAPALLGRAAARARAQTYPDPAG